MKEDIMNVLRGVVGFLAGVPSAFILYAVAGLLDFIYLGTKKEKASKVMLEITIIALTGILAQSVILAQGVALYFAVARLKTFLIYCKDRGVAIPPIVDKLIHEKEVSGEGSK